MVIVGAGPAGSSAAYFLSTVFDMVLLVDKEDKTTYEKLCGGAVAQDALLHLRDYWHLEFDQVYNGGELYYKNRLITQVKSDTLEIAMVMRRDLDVSLINKVREQGVEVRLSTQVNKITFDETLQQYHLTLNTGEITSTYLVAADGSPSFVRKTLGMSLARYQKDLVMAYEIHLPKSPDMNIHDVPKLYFGDFMGYSWIFPKKAYLTVGVGGFEQPKTLKRKLEEFCLSLGLPHHGIKGHWIPFNGVMDEVVNNNCFAVGDAAGLVEPIAGKGLYYALESGRLLAQVFSHVNPEQHYETLLGDLRRDIAYGLKIRWFLYHRPWSWLGMRAVRKIPQLSDEVMRLVCGDISFREFWFTVWKRSPKLLIKTLV